MNGRGEHAEIAAFQGVQELDPDSRMLLNFLQRHRARFARLPQPNPVPSDPYELTRSVLDLWLESTRGIEIRLDAPKGLPRILVDPGQFRQALGNLVKNAIEAMPSGGTLTLTLEKVGPPEKPGVGVSVRDSGPGLPADLRDRIFDPYVTTKTHGSGLGLAIVHRIVTDHGGSVDVETAEGAGTTFRLVFPAAPALDGSPRPA